MSAWKARVFWKDVTVTRAEGGFSVLLDGRPVRTPGKVLLILPTEGLALAVAAEWRAQKGVVRPETMPMTRMANSAVEKVAPKFDEVVAHLASYGETDLLCHRAGAPAGLVERQSAGWDPLLHWCAQTLSAPLTTTTGIIAVQQPASSIVRFKQLMTAMSPFQLAAFYDLVAIPGSIILGFAVAQGRLGAAEAFDLGRIDDDWQAELWGVDEEAARFSDANRAALHDAANFFALSG